MGCRLPVFLWVRFPWSVPRCLAQTATLPMLAGEGPALVLGGLPNGVSFRRSVPAACAEGAPVWVQLPVFLWDGALARFQGSRCQDALTTGASL